MDLKKLWPAIIAAVILVGGIVVISRQKETDIPRGEIAAENEVIGSDTLIIVERSGGLCPDGRVCEDRITIYGNGEMTRSRTGETAAISSDEVRGLSSAITKKNIEELKRKKFSGLCPTAYDGMETVYIFVVEGKEERISSCEYEIPADNLLIGLVVKAVETAGW